MEVCAANYQMIRWGRYQRSNILMSDIRKGQRNAENNMFKCKVNMWNGVEVAWLQAAHILV